jgi:methyl-accepting chemotaxis protein
MTHRLRLYHKTLIAQHVTIIAAVIFFCAGAFFIGKRLIVTLNTVNTAGNDVHDTFTVINRPRTGTLAGIDETIFGASALMKKGNGILDHEEKQLSTLDTQEATLFDDLHKIAVNANGEVTNLDTATTTLNTLLGNINTSAEKAPQLVDNMSELADNLSKMTNDTNATVNSADTKKLLGSMVGTAVHVEGITGNIDKITTHLEKTIDSPPTLKQKITGAFDLLWKIGMLVR